MTGWCWRIHHLCTSCCSKPPNRCDPGFPDDQIPVIIIASALKRISPATSCHVSKSKEPLRHSCRVQRLTNQTTLRPQRCARRDLERDRSKESPFSGTSISDRTRLTIISGGTARSVRGKIEQRQRQACDFCFLAPIADEPANFGVVLGVGAGAAKKAA